MTGRVRSVTVILGLAAAPYHGLTTYADRVIWTRASAAAWSAHVYLNALSVSINLHVAIGRRWPFGGGEAAGTGVPGGQEPL